MGYTCFLDYDAPPPRGFPRNAATTFDHHHQHQAALEPEPTEKINISDKMETIDYSHGVSAAISASRGWGSDGGVEGGEPPTVQSVDYNHGQGAARLGDFAGGGGYPAAQGAYGGFPYSEYEGFPPGVQQSGLFPQGVDAASIFAAYNEQAGEP